MSQTEDSLQEIIEQLEKGEPVEVCTDGLPVQEAEVVQLISNLRAVPFPDEDEKVVVFQEAAVLAAAQKQFAPTPTPKAKETAITAVILAHIQSWWEQLRAQPQLAGGFVAVLVLAILAVAWITRSPNMNNEATLADKLVVNEAAEEAVPPVPGTVIEDEVAPSEMAVEEGAEVAAAASTSGSTVYIPLMTVNLETNPQSAVIEGIQGVVEVQNGGDVWTAVNNIGTLAAGQRLRTGALSQATLTFYDGSQAFLDANTEISIDELNALPPEEGFRTVVMTQWVGDSNHKVAFRNDGGSRYEVKSPSGSGLARGTEFQVLVTPDQLARYTVTEGKVDVTGYNRTVSVTAGQLTTITPGNGPVEPAFNISGEGKVEAIGETWIIAGQNLSNA